MYSNKIKSCRLESDASDVYDTVPSKTIFLWAITQIKQTQKSQTNDWTNVCNWKDHLAYKTGVSSANLFSTLSDQSVT